MHFYHDVRQLVNFFIFRQGSGRRRQEFDFVVGKEILSRAFFLSPSPHIELH